MYSMKRLFQTFQTMPQSSGGEGFKLFQPAVKVRAFAADAGESNFQYGKHSLKRLLVTGRQSLYAFGRRGVRRIVDLLQCRKLLPDLSKAGFQIGAADTVAEGGAVAKEQAFE